MLLQLQLLLLAVGVRQGGSLPAARHWTRGLLLLLLLLLAAQRSVPCLLPDERHCPVQKAGTRGLLLLLGAVSRPLARRHWPSQRARLLHASGAASQRRRGMSARRRRRGCCICCCYRCRRGRALPWLLLGRGLLGCRRPARHLLAGVGLLSKGALLQQNCQRVYQGRRSGGSRGRRGACAPRAL